jgi:hypothetical protein
MGGGGTSTYVIYLLCTGGEGGGRGEGGEGMASGGQGEGKGRARGGEGDGRARGFRSIIFFFHF